MPLWLMIALAIAPISIIQMIFGCDGDDTISVQLLEWGLDD